MKKLRTPLALLCVGMGINLLANPVQAAPAGSSSRKVCADQVNGMCDAYCWSQGSPNCVVHWEDREACSFHIDSCF